MRKMSKQERKNIKHEIFLIMSNSTGREYAKYILDQYDDITENTMSDDIVKHVLETSAWEDEGYYNEDDIRLAIGRELMARLGVEV